MSSNCETKTSSKIKEYYEFKESVTDEKLKDSFNLKLLQDALLEQKEKFDLSPYYSMLKKVRENTFSHRGKDFLVEYFQELILPKNITDGGSSRFTFHIQDIKYNNDKSKIDIGFATNSFEEATIKGMIHNQDRIDSLKQIVFSRLDSSHIFNATK
jgi:hypothetical protein